MFKTVKKWFNFADSLNSQQQYVSRIEQFQFSAIGGLPDPDPVLRTKNLNMAAYRDLLIDPHLSAVIAKRKSGVLSMLWEIKGDNVPEKQRQFYEQYFRSIDFCWLIDKILDAVFFGYQPFVIFWDFQNGSRVPRIEDRPQEYFFYDPNNQLRIHTKQSHIDGMLADPRIFLVARHKPSYLNPYGERIASRIFWPITFKKGGMKFWLTMTEKYGMPFLLGKQSSAASKEDTDSFLNMLSNMIQDAVAVVNSQDSVEVLDTKATGSLDLYSGLVNFCNSEISKAVLTVTNTVELQDRTGSFAASKVHQDGEQALNHADRLIVENFLNQLIKTTHLINFGLSEPPTITLYKEEDVDMFTAQRDEVLTRVGVTFTKDYIKKAYNLQDDDFNLKEVTKIPAQFSEQNPKSARSIDNLTNSMPAALLQMQMEQTLKPVLDLIRNAKDYSEIKNALTELYPEMKTSQFEMLLQKVLFIAELEGRLNV